ncbi:hypothetical protein [Sphaerisporangium sp. TRM90804]|uniref:hypothetical protein n=1 Tax=Sphaerisporangium sp. TRM90804 TaxID=3031113 RepID=UPI00244805D2|nr:hypothetical protein [Sphaerisporangium sp. TRM90804]MDH2424889.1 hypothetical protein [Sphaerisporangium sp. TRM90804]
MDLSAAVNELYGHAPEDFVLARANLAARVKKGGDPALAKQIGALRRPTVSAWAVNQLARSAPDELDGLLEVGTELRAAWAAGEHVAELDQRRGELITRLVRTVERLATEAERPLREPAVREVQETLHAATMDPEVADEVAEGRLAQPRAYAGFAPVGEGAPRAQTTPRRPTPKKRADKQQSEEEKRREEEERRRRLTEQAEAAAAEAREAEEALAEWQAEVDAAEQACTEIAEEESRLRRELNAVLDRQDALLKRFRMSERERNRATRRAEETRRRADEARNKLS